MEPDVLQALRTAAVLFGIAALGGIVMTLIRLRGAPRPPTLIAMIHGLLAAAGLTLLVYFAVVAGLPPLVKVATVILALAAAGGAFLAIRFHAQLQPLPIPIVLVHGLLAVTGFVVLVYALGTASAPSP
jgi:hypothetical protein